MLRSAALALCLALVAGCVDRVQDALTDGKSSDTGPTVAFVNSEREDQLVVEQAGPDFSWSKVNVTGNRPAYFRLNDGPATPFGSMRATPVGSGPLTAGDKVDFCMPQPGELAVRLLYTPDNVIIHQFTFELVDTHHYCR